MPHRLMSQGQDDAGRYLWRCGECRRAFASKDGNAYIMLSKLDCYVVIDAPTKTDLQVADAVREYARTLPVHKRKLLEECARRLHEPESESEYEKQARQAPPGFTAPRGFDPAYMGGRGFGKSEFQRRYYEAMRKNKGF